LLDLPDQEIEDLRAQAAGISVDTLLDYFDFMAAGDEEVGRSPNPRFVLETIMVRLATLPQTVSIPLLLERLEKLERRLPAASRSVSAPAQEGTEPISQPAVPASPAVAPLAGDKDGVWQNFVAFVGKEKKFLASHLQAGTVIELPPAQLTVGVIERHHLNYLQDPDNLTALKGFAKRFFGDDVAIVITGMDPEGTGRKSESIGSGAGNSEGEGSSMVKEALRIFGGSIKTARRENG
jgi:hypothetical protein